METTRRRDQAYQLRIGCISKANRSKGWKRIDCGIKRIGCVSTVRNGSTRQTDRLLSNDDRRLSSFQAPIEPTMAPVVASPVVAGLKGHLKGTGNSRNRRFGMMEHVVDRCERSNRTMTVSIDLKRLSPPLPLLWQTASKQARNGSKGRFS
jgi:hypothetical protein